MDISIVIPTHNRSELLKQCLDSVFSQDYPKDKYEVIVVMDGDDEVTEKMLENLRNRHPNLRYVLQQKKGPAAARNLGASLAEGEIVGFTDDDCILGKDWIKKITLAHNENTDIAVIGGFTEVKDKAAGALVSQFLANGAITTLINGKEEVIFFPTCNVSFKKNLLEKEKFNEIFPLPAGEDLEYFWRLFKKDYRYLYRKDIIVIHDRKTNLRSFVKQAYMYGMGNYLVQHIHKDQPLLKEIRTGRFSFIFALIINFIKIPRFSYLLGRRLINLERNISLYKKFQIYVYFSLHKIFYLIGNIAEYFRVLRLQKGILFRQNETTRKELSKPDLIILDITHRCNIKCNICEIRKDKPVKEFTTGEVKDLIAQATEWGVKNFALSGGEPFVREDIFEILDFVKEKEYHIGILTNGILLTQDFVNKLLPYLISNALSLSISLDALTAEIHEDIRGSKGCFEKTFNGLKILSEFKKSYPTINFNTISIILNENLEELLPLAEFLKSLDVNSIQFQPLLANNLIMERRSGRVKYWIPKEKLSVFDRVMDSLIEFKRQNFELVRNSENNLNLVKKYFRGLLTRDDVKCLYGTKTMLIANNGDVTTCFDCYGSAKKERLQDIHISMKAESARKNASRCEKPCLLPCFTDN